MSEESLIHAKTSSALQDLLHSRYRQEAFVPNELKSTIETMLNQRSIRTYSNKALKPNMLELLVAAMQSASSSANLQTWSVAAVLHLQRNYGRLLHGTANENQRALRPAFFESGSRLGSYDKASQIGCGV
jgi:hypothetical protein